MKVLLNVSKKKNIFILIFITSRVIYQPENRLSEVHISISYIFKVKVLNIRLLLMAINKAGNAFRLFQLN